MRAVALSLLACCVGCAEHDYVGLEPQLVLGGSAYADFAFAVDDWDGDGHADFLTRIADESWAGESLGTLGRIASGRDGRTFGTMEPPLRLVEWDWRVILGDDLDSDGVADLVVPASRQYVSGRDGRELRRLDGPTGSPCGEACTLVDDLDGDGAREIALGVATFGDDVLPAIGVVVLLSSRDGHVLVERRGGVAYEQLGADIERYGDFDLDGVDDIAVGSPGGPGKGVIGIHSGRDLRRLHEFTSDALDETAIVQALGSVFVVCGDLSGDRATEFAVAQGDHWFVVSFEAHATLTALGGPDVHLADWVGDWDGDGVRDVVQDRGVSESVGFDSNIRRRSEVLSTRTGAALLSVGSAGGFSCGRNCGDFDADGQDDVVFDIGGDKLLVYGSASFR